MDIPIRMIDFATAACWIFLIAFCATAAYSTKDLGLDFGNPRMAITTDNRILVSLPLSIANNGYYSLRSFNFSTKLLSEDGSTIAQGSTLIPTIGIGEKVSILHNLTLDIDDLLHSNQEFLFNDTQLNITESIGMVIGEVLPVQASGNISIPWGAPLYDLKLEEPQYSAVNYTQMQVMVPMSFDDHAFFDVIGEVYLRMYNSANQLIGLGQSMIDAAPHSHYDGQIDLNVAVSSITQTGRFELDFQTSLFSFSSKVIQYG
jgi:hypothetical protein